MRDQTSFAISRVRGDQLRMLSRHLRLNSSELIASWIDRGLEEAGLNAALPGVEVIRNDAPAITLKLDGFEMSFPAAQDAADAANLIDGVCDKGSSGMLLAGSGTFAVTRRGSGVALESTGADGDVSKTTFAPHVARAIARQLRSQAH
jgi:hypothetical protein